MELLDEMGRLIDQEFHHYTEHSVVNPDTKKEIAKGIKTLEELDELKRTVKKEDTD